MKKNKYLDVDEESDTDTEDEEIDIHHLVRQGVYQDIKEAIAKDRPRLICLKDKFDRIALHYAVALNMIKVSVFLIAKQSNINAKDIHEQTPLHLAAMNGYTEMCRTLLEFDADIRLRDKSCWTALHHAVEGNFYETATLLAKRGVDLAAEDHKYGRTALHIAAEKGFNQIANMLMIRGADISLSGDYYYGKTPLHLSCMHGHTDVCGSLIKRGADVSVLSGFLDKNPLHLACEFGHFDCAEILSDSGVDLNAFGNHINGSTALHICAAFDRADIIKMLVQKGADKEKLGRFSTIGTPLHIASEKGNAHAANMLVNLGADINSRDEAANTPLHVACKNGNYDVAFMLIDLHADTSLIADNGKTALELVVVPTIRDKMKISAKKAYIILQAKLEKEDKIRQIEADKLASELEALERQRLYEEEIIRQRQQYQDNFIIALRAVSDVSGELAALIGIAELYPEEDINININTVITEDDELTLEDASLADVGTVVRVSVPQESHSRISTIGSTRISGFGLESGRCTALTRACTRGFYDIVHALLRWPNIDINFQEETSGNTALHNAAYIGHREIVEELLLAGAKITLINKEGKVAANVARTNYLREVIRNTSLITNRNKYQDLVSDQLFLQIKAKSGAALTLNEALKINNCLEYNAHENTDNDRSLPIIHSNESIESSRSLISTIAHSTHVDRLPIIIKPINVPTKYGSIPNEFAGSAGDFFFSNKNIISLYEESITHTHNISNEYKHNNNSIITGFLDLLTLQYSYIPSSFDRTEEWNEVKDFLWCFGQPYKLIIHKELKIKYNMHMINQSFISMISIYLKEPIGFICNNIISSQQTNRIDKRSYYYLFGCTLNEIQNTFTYTWESQQLLDSIQDTIHINDNESIYTATSIKSKKSEISGNNISKIIPEIKNNQINSMNELENSNSYLDYYYHIRLSNIPSNILSKDIKRIIIFSRQCELLLELIILLFQPHQRDIYYTSWYHRNLHTYSKVETLQRLTCNINVLKQFNLISSTSEKNMCKLTTFIFSALFLDANIVIKSYSTNKTDEQIDNVYNNHNNNSNDNGNSSYLSDFFVNPPRSLRIAIDLIYDIMEFIKSRIEPLYPNDTIRAHLWSHSARQIIQKEKLLLLHKQSTIIPIETNSSINAVMYSTKLQDVDDMIDYNSVNTYQSNETTTNIMKNSELENYSSIHSQTPIISQETKNDLIYKLWLNDLYLLDYYSYFIHNGYRIINDFIGLSEQDCVEFFPFLKTGDLRRLVKAIHMISNKSIKKLEARI